MDEQILEHYGVKGMKWGVIRSRKQLYNRADKLSRKNDKIQTKVDKFDERKRKYDTKSNKVNSKNSKYEKRISKAEAKKAKHEYKSGKMTTRMLGLTDYHNTAISKQDARIRKAQGKLKYNKWTVKSEKMRVAAANGRAKIAKNDKYIRMCNRTIDAIDEGTIRRGRIFMQYVTD